MHETKLYPCAKAGRNVENELIIVEGVSASRAVLGCRDDQYQAVLPMQGKPLNAMKASAATVKRNPLFDRLIKALGTGIGDQFALSQVAYRRIVMLFDPDADGIHCGVLLSVFFHRWMPELIRDGRLVVVRPPACQLNNQRTGESRFAYLDDEIAGLRSRMSGPSGIDSVSLRRFRGLASLPAATLRYDCVAQGTRRCHRITEADLAAMISIFGMKQTHEPIE